MPPEAAAAVAAPAATVTPSAPPASAGAQLSIAPAPEWAASFQDAQLKTYVAEKNFSNPEMLAKSYYNLEKMRGVPEDRLIKLPEKMEGPEARAVWERLGAPKEAKGYELPKAEVGHDDAFADWAANTFHQNGVPKSMAQSIAQAWNDYNKSEFAKQNEAQVNNLKQADETLKKEWGQHYDSNINLAKQGVKILGLDAGTLDQLEALQGRAQLFKTLSKLGASVGESTFVSGQGGTPTPKSAADAQSEIKSLTHDKKFGKSLQKGDVEALKRWNELHQLAYPGDKPIG